MYPDALDPDVFNPTPDAISQVLLLIKSGKPAKGYVRRPIHLDDGRFVKVSSSGERLRVEAMAMQLVGKVRPPWLYNYSQSHSVFLAHHYSCPKGPYGVCT